MKKRFPCLFFSPENIPTKNWASKSIVFKIIAGFVLFLLFAPAVTGQELDVAYVPTPELIVEKMLDMADVVPGDYVIDLGCGDGRIVIAAAKRGAFGHGVDLDPQRIREAELNALKAGVADSVMFVEEDVFETDFSRANVIAMYLFPSINIKLRPKLLENLEPGSRIVSHDFGMGEWKPDKQHGRMDTHAVYLWIVPARVEGTWNWKADGDEFTMRVKQEFQEIELHVLYDGSKLNVKNSLLSGKRISFLAVDNSSQKEFVFSGKAGDGIIEGIIQIHNGEEKFVENWLAVME